MATTFRDIDELLLGVEDGHRLEDERRCIGSGNALALEMLVCDAHDLWVLGSFLQSLEGEGCGSGGHRQGELL